MVTDLLERQSLGEELRRAGVAQGMPAPMGGLDSKRHESAVGDIIDASRLQ